MENKGKILVVEDEATIREFIVLNLNRAGFDTVEAEDGEDGFAKYIENNDIELAVLDVAMPRMDGMELCLRLRARSDRLGIILLTAKSQEEDKITGFSNGADDYVTKPFSPSELVMRILALYRKINAIKELSGEQSSIESGPFVIDTIKREILKDGKRIDLTQIEYALMMHFCNSKGKALRRSDILKAVWKNEPDIEEKAVDVNIRRLRMKIEENPREPIYIETIWGFGYRWKV